MDNLLAWIGQGTTFLDGTSATRSTNAHRHFLQLCGALCAIWLLLNLPILLGIHVLPWDAIDEFYPTVYFNAHSLRHGLAPWWNPYIYSGYPQIADPQGMLFSPLLMIWMLLRSDPSVVWFSWGVLLHMLMGGIGVLALLRRSAVNDFGALIGATVFIGGGVAASRLEHTPDVLAYAYAPVVLLALRHFMASPSWRRGLLLGFVAGAFVTQLTQVTYLFALLIIVYGMIATMLHWRLYSASARMTWCVGALVAIVTALLIGVPQLLFSWAFVSVSNRATIPLAAALPASLDARIFLALFDPNIFHALRGTYSGPASQVEAYFYVGAIPVLLLVGINQAWRVSMQRRQLAFFAMVLAFACFYMFGPHTPFYGWLYAWLPGMQQFRRPSDAAYLFNFSLAIFAGISASHFKLDSKRHVTALLIVAACWLAAASAGMRGDGMRWQSATMAASVFAVLALWRLHKPSNVRQVAIWLLLLLVVDYRCFNLNGALNENKNIVHRFMSDPTADFLVAQQPLSGALDPRIETIDASTMWDNYVILRHIHSTQGYNPLRYALYDQWYGGRDNGTAPRVNTDFNPAPDSKLTDLLGVQYVVRGHSPSSPPLPASYKKIFTGPNTDAWRNSHAYSRVLTPTHANVQPVGQPMTVDVFAKTDFENTVWLTPQNAVEESADQAAAATCTSRLHASVIHIAPTELGIRTDASAPGWLVLGELDFPGWQADADGVALPIHRANGMFRAVCVPAGNHFVRWSFHPWLMVAEAWQQAHR